jgi:hypothetical protein
MKNSIVEMIINNNAALLKKTLSKKPDDRRYITMVTLQGEKLLLRLRPSSQTKALFSD